MKLGRHAVYCMVMALGVTACSSVPSMDEVFPDRKNDYKETRELADLEVPPGLSGATLTEEELRYFQANPELAARAGVGAGASGYDSPYENNSSLNEPAYADYRAAQTYAVDPNQPAAGLSEEDRLNASLELLGPLAEDEPLPDVPFALSERSDPPYILAKGDFSNTWNAAGEGIINAGYRIAAKYREQGFFSIVTPESEQSDGGAGLLSALAFWRDDEVSEQTSLNGEYLIHVAEDQGGTVIEVLDMEGFSATGAEAGRILRDLHGQLKQ